MNQRGRRATVRALTEMLMLHQAIYVIAGRGAGEWSDYCQCGILTGRGSGQLAAHQASILAEHGVRA